MAPLSGANPSTRTNRSRPLTLVVGLLCALVALGGVQVDPSDGDDLAAFAQTQALSPAGSEHDGIVRTPRITGLFCRNDWISTCALPAFAALDLNSALAYRPPEEGQTARPSGLAYRRAQTPRAPPAGKAAIA